MLELEKKLEAFGLKGISKGKVADADHATGGYRFESLIWTRRTFGGERERKFKFENDKALSQTLFRQTSVG